MAQPGPSDPEATALNERGQEAHRSGDFETAVVLFKEAQKIEDRPSFWFNLAQSAYRLDDCDTALAAYKRFLAAADEGPAASRATERVSELEPRCGPATNDVRLATVSNKESTSEAVGSIDATSAASPRISRFVIRTGIGAWTVFPQCEEDPFTSCDNAKGRSAALLILGLDYHLYQHAQFTVSATSHGLVVLDGNDSERSWVSVGSRIESRRRVHRFHGGGGASIGYMWSRSAPLFATSARGGFAISDRVDFGAVVVGSFPSGSAVSATVGAEVIVSVD